MRGEGRPLPREARGLPSPRKQQLPFLLKQGGEAVGQAQFQVVDLDGDLVGGSRGGVFVEIAGEGDLVTYFALAVVYPGIGGKGEDLAGEVVLYIFLEGDILGIAAGGIGLALAGLAAALFGGVRIGCRGRGGGGVRFGRGGSAGRSMVILV